MKLFINSGVCGRKWNGNVKIKDSSSKKSLCLAIPNYLEEKCSQEMIKFIFDPEEISKEDLERDCLLKNVSLRKTSKNTYHIKQSEKTTEQCMYALIRSTAVIPDDVFIPTSMKDKVEVLRRIRFVDDEPDYGIFLSNVYLIKIKLNCHESIPIYLAYDNPYVLQEHYVIFKTEYKDQYQVTDKLKTFIYIDEYNKDEYTSLSELC